MIYYLNTFIIYSIMGFILESSLYKFKTSDCYSGILFGPFTIIYGFGCIFLVLLDKYVFKRMKCNIVLKLVVIYILSAVTLTLTELTGGIILKYLFHTEMWDYTSKAFNFGKYICLEMASIWGILGVMFVYFIKPFFDKIFRVLTPTFTKAFTLVIILNLIISIIVQNKELILSFL